jgi:hypothetical protein
MTKKDEGTGVRIETIYRDAHLRILRIRAAIVEQEEVYAQKISELLGRQMDPPAWKGIVPWPVQLFMVMALPVLYNYFALPSFLVILALMAMYAGTGIRYDHLKHGLNKARSLRSQLSHICATERTGLTSVLISIILYTSLGVAVSSGGFRSFLFILLIINFFEMVSVKRWRRALADLRELDVIEQRNAEIHRLRRQLLEVEEGMPAPEILLDADKEASALVRTRGKPF